jgi:hypothetical protein
MKSSHALQSKQRASVTMPTYSQHEKEDPKLSRGGTELKMKGKEDVGEEVSRASAIPTELDLEQELSQHQKVQILDRQTALA